MASLDSEMSVWLFNNDRPVILSIKTMAFRALTVSGRILSSNDLII